MQKPVLPLVAEQRVLDDLIRQHGKFLDSLASSGGRTTIDLFEDNSEIWDSVRALADKIERVGRNLNKLEQRTLDEESDSAPRTCETLSSTRVEQYASQSSLPPVQIDDVREPDSKEKLAFLSILNIEPRCLHDGLPTHRKSKRKPAPKITAYHSIDTRTGQPPKKRVVRRTRAPEIDNCSAAPRPSSVPATMADPSLLTVELAQPLTLSTHSSHKSPLKTYVDSASVGENNAPSANRLKAPTLTNRFITQTVVNCASCNEPFTVHHVGGAWGGTLSPKTNPVCFVCQISTMDDDKV